MLENPKIADMFVMVVDDGERFLASRLHGKLAYLEENLDLSRYSVQLDAIEGAISALDRHANEPGGLNVTGLAIVHMGVERMIEPLTMVAYESRLRAACV